jgi:hypothetical protein
MQIVNGLWQAVEVVARGITRDRMLANGRKNLAKKGRNFGEISVATHLKFVNFSPSDASKFCVLLIVREFRTGDNTLFSSPL